MIGAIREITVNEGFDPRGACWWPAAARPGSTSCPSPRASAVREVLVPRTAGALSACGAQFSDVVAEFTVTEFTTTGDFDVDCGQRRPRAR